MKHFILFFFLAFSAFAQTTNPPGVITITGGAVTTNAPVTNSLPAVSVGYTLLNTNVMSSPTADVTFNFNITTASNITAKGISTDATSLFGTASIASSGWTNTLGVNATVFVSAGSGALVYGLVVIGDPVWTVMTPTNVFIPIKPGWKIIGTNLVGKAVAF